MKPDTVMPRILAFFLSFALILPSPALALRSLQQTESGMKELKEKLHSEQPPGGMENVGLEEFGQWSRQKAQRGWAKLKAEYDRRFQRHLGASVDIFHWLPDYRGFWTPLLEEWAEHPEEARTFLIGLDAKSRLSQMNETRLEGWLDTKNHELMGVNKNHYVSMQAELFALKHEKNVERRWLLAVTRSFYVDLVKAFMKNAQARDGDNWKTWLNACRDIVVELVAKQHAFVQWYLRNRFPGKDGFVLMHGSDGPPVAPGHWTVEDHFRLTWLVEEVYPYARKQLLVVKVPFDRVQGVSWLDKEHGEDEVWITAGSIEVLATLSPEQIDASGIPSHTNRVPSTTSWTYQGNDLPGWADALIEKGAGGNRYRGHGLGAGAGLEEIVKQVKSNRAVVIDGADLARTPGLAGLVSELRRAGLEDQILVVEPDATVEELGALADRLRRIPDLVVTIYSRSNDRAIKQLEAALRQLQVQVVEGRLGNLHVTLRRMLANLGVARRSIPSIVDQLYERAGLSTAA